MERMRVAFVLWSLATPTARGPVDWAMCARLSMLKKTLSIGQTELGFRTRHAAWSAQTVHLLMLGDNVGNSSDTVAHTTVHASTNTTTTHTPVNTTEREERGKLGGRVHR